MAGGDEYGPSVPPSMVGYEMGEYSSGVPSPMRSRKVFEQTQPTVMSSMGMHALPPVSVRTPISDQYASGIARPDLSVNIPDPTIFKNVNGNIALGEGYDSRRAGLVNLRQRIMQQRRARNSVVDTVDSWQSGVY